MEVTTVHSFRPPFVVPTAPSNSGMANVPLNLSKKVVESEERKIRRYVFCLFCIIVVHWPFSRHGCSCSSVQASFGGVFRLDSRVATRWSRGRCSCCCSLIFGHRNPFRKNRRHKLTVCFCGLGRACTHVEYQKKEDSSFAARLLFGVCLLFSFLTSNPVVRSKKN